MKSKNYPYAKVLKMDEETVFYDSIPFYELSCYFAYNLICNLEKPDYRVITLAIEQLTPEQKIKFVNYLNDNQRTGDSYRYLDFASDYNVIELLNDINESRLNVTFLQLREVLTNYLLSNIHNIIGKKILTAEIEKLSDLFRLSYNELLIMLFILLTDENDSYNSFMRRLQFTDFMKIVTIATGIDRREVKSILYLKSRLLRSHIIENIGNSTINFSLNEDIKFFLLGYNNGLENNLFNIINYSQFDINSFNIDKIELDILVSLLKGNKKCNILFYGEPGTGKTELSKSVINYCGKRAIFVNHSDKERKVTQLFAFEAALGMAGKNDVVVVDEADYLLSSRFINISGLLDLGLNQNKSWINDLLDRSNGKVIWIINWINNIDKSTARRFDYSIEFKPFSKKERINAWKMALKGISGADKKNNLLSRRDIAYLSEKYPLNFGAISFSLNLLKNVSSKRISYKRRKEYLEKILSNQLKLQGIKSIDKRLNEMNSFYDFSVLNTDFDLRELINVLKDFKSFKQNQKGNESIGINLLFYGISGSGKTEFVKYISRTLRMGLIQYRASDLMNMYVGETEKKIGSAFKKAEQEEAILLIDEADSFFMDRVNAIRSWEVSMTNELLTQMESHNTIFIACTNLFENFDKASIRRFHWKVEFYPLSDIGKLKLYKKYFTLKGRKFNYRHQKMLSEINPLTPGDFKAVWKRLFYVLGEGISHDRVIEEIRREVFLKRQKEPKRIGLI